MKILGISCHYHDSSACLIVDGEVVAGAQEERFTRIKHDNSFPERSIDFCLGWAGVDPSEIDCVAFYEKPIWKFERILEQHIASFPLSLRIFEENIDSWFTHKMNIKSLLRKKVGYTGKILYFPHHESHAASGFYLSGFNEAAIVTVDGVGEWATATIGYGKKQKIRVDKEIKFPHSIGLLYSAITSYLGFEVNDAEYKVMGFAAFGDPEPYLSKFEELISLFPDGSFALNMKYFDYVWSGRMFSKKLVNLLGLPPRPPGHQIQKEYADIAASLQLTLQKCLINVCNAAYDRYKTTNLILSGGVALNSVANGKILSNTKFKKLFIPPDPGDGGASMGSAFLAHAFLTRERPQQSSFVPYIGPSYPAEQVKDVISRYGLSYKEYPTTEALLDKVSDLLIKQKVIGWFQGRMEWGPRALGNRSILASAEKQGMRNKINIKVKHREPFRPFAPAVMDEYASSYFKTDIPLPESSRYMLLVYPFSKKGLSGVPATVHTDGTGRLQTVDKKDNELFYELIDTYRQKTGVPAILNTSFNVRGEPIVCSPRDAVRCFLKTDIDYLVMGNMIISKDV